MSTTNYVIGWLAYIVGSAGLTLALYLAVRHSLRRELSQLLVVLAAAFLLMPFSVSSDHALLAPAWVMTIMEAIAGGDHSAWRAGTALLMALLAAAILALGLAFFQRTRALSDGDTVANEAESAIKTVDTGLSATEVPRSGDS